MRERNEKAIALIICISVLFVLSILATSFATLATQQRKVSLNDLQSFEVRLLAKSSLDYTVAELIAGYQNNNQFMDWRFFKPDPDAVKDPLYSPTLYAEDQVGAGVAISQVQSISDPDNTPSFKQQIAGRNVSGSIADDQHLYTLKIFDSSSQLNINSNAVFLGEMLDSLSRAIAKRAPYIFQKGDDGVGPLKGMGKYIVEQRPTTGYCDKREIIGLSDGNNTITKEDYEFVKDFLTTFPTTKEMEETPLFSNISFATPGDEKAYQAELRSPINVNTASWPVLFAIFRGLKAVNFSNDVSIEILRLRGQVEQLEHELLQYQALLTTAEAIVGSSPSTGNIPDSPTTDPTNDTGSTGGNTNGGKPDNGSGKPDNGSTNGGKPDNGSTTGGTNTGGTTGGTNTGGTTDGTNTGGTTPIIPKPEIPDIQIPDISPSGQLTFFIKQIELLERELDLVKGRLQEAEKELLNQGGEEEVFTITEEDAIVLANRICQRRKDKLFVDWQDFYDFLGQEKNDIFKEDPLEKESIVKANCNPTASLDRLNPDSSLYHFINKSELLYSTTELVFFPLGRFEVTSLAEIFDSKRQLKASCQFYAEVNVFDTAMDKTQHDFEDGGMYNNLAQKIQDQGFTHGNNLQQATADVDKQASKFVGALKTIWYSAETGYSGFDEPKEINQGGTEPVGEGGNYTFRADFNGNLNANKGQNFFAFGTKAAQVNAEGLAVPNEGLDGGTFADLTADGLVLDKDDDYNENTIYYLSRPNEDPAIDSPEVDGNFPAMVKTQILPLDGQNNQGTLMFWVKISDNWDSTEWRTIFFINTAFKIPNPLTGEIYMMGIQREVQMKVEKVFPGLSLLRKVSFQVRAKFFCEHDGQPVKPPLEFMPYEFVDFGRSMVIDPKVDKGLHAQEFYNIALRWNDGTSMKNFSDASNQAPSNKPNTTGGVIKDAQQQTAKESSIAVTGNFYDLNDKQVATTTIYDQNSGVFFDEIKGQAIDNIRYDEFLDNNFFEAVDNGLKFQNRFYVGNAGRTASPQMTVDDIRVSKDINWANDPSFRPSRHPIPETGGDPSFGSFKGKFVNVPNKVVAITAAPMVFNPPSNNNQQVLFQFDKDSYEYGLDFQVNQNSPAPINDSPTVIAVTFTYFHKTRFMKYFEE